jgi:lipopolysaccharide export system protein LptC
MTAPSAHEASEALGLWEPKRTLTLEAARRHTQRIRLLRWLLLGVAGLLLCFLIWQFASEGPPDILQDNPDESVKMVNPRYTGRTDDGLPFYLTAAEAVRTTADDSTVNLISPILHFFREEGAEESQIIAKSGVYDDVLKILDLDTDVQLQTDDGTECLTTHARIFAKTKIVEGDKPIACSGNFGNVNGNAYEILDNYKTFVFKNGMDAVLEQDGPVIAVGNSGGGR